MKEIRDKYIKNGFTIDSVEELIYDVKTKYLETEEHRDIVIAQTFESKFNKLFDFQLLKIRQSLTAEGRDIIKNEILSFSVDGLVANIYFDINKVEENERSDARIKPIDYFKNAQEFELFENERMLLKSKYWHICTNYFLQYHDMGFKGDAINNVVRSSVVGQKPIIR